MERLKEKLQDANVLFETKVIGADEHQQIRKNLIKRFFVV